MSAGQVGFAAAAAVLVQTTLAWSVSGTSPNLDLPLVVVVLAALSRGPLAGLWSGTAVGFAQDVLSGGIIGVTGLCKSVVGVAAGAAGERLLANSAWRRGLVVAVATFVHAGCFFGAYALVPATTLIGGWRDIAVQALANGLAGCIAIGIANRWGRWRPPRRRAAGWAVGQWRENAP